MAEGKQLEAVKLLRHAADMLEARGDNERRATPAITSNGDRPNVTRSTTDTVLQEQRQLFGRLSRPRARPSATTTRLTNLMSSTLRGNSNKEGSQKRKKIKKLLCLLPGKTACKVPSLQDRSILRASGLGENTIYFPVDGTASDVKSALIREFPALEEGSGFELLRTAERSRTDLVVSCVGTCSVDQLCSLSSGRVYIRPIQANIPMDYSLSTFSADELEECLSCGKFIQLEELRAHLRDCKQTTNSLQTDEELHVLPDLEDQATNSDEHQSEMQISNEPLGTDTGLVGIDTEPVGTDTGSVVIDTEPVGTDIGSVGTDIEPVGSDTKQTDTCVSLDDIFKEVLPLEVTFYGEEAEDLGGPRKEFLSALLKEITREEHRLCIKEDGGLFSLTNIEQMRDKHWYFAAGLTCGLSVIQNGPLPTFLKDFDSISTTVLNGLNIVGLTDLIRVKPCMKFLFRPGAMTDVSVRRLRQLLHPKFNEPGSNKRTRQEKIYALFLRYIKEVAAGRREVPNGKIFMGHILAFVTSSSQEPVLGYTLPPKICFVEDTYGSLLPTS